MSHRTGRFLLAGVLVLLALSCAKLPEPASPPKEGFAQLPDGTTIPSDWGNLVSTSSVPLYQDLVQLWFQDEKGMIHMVVYNLRTNQLNLESRMIPRK